jgi:LysM repeat protein
MKKRFPTLTRCWLGLTVLLAMLFSTPVGYGMAQGTTVLVDPSSGEVVVGATTAVNVRIENVSGLYGFEVHLTFNPALLEVVDADLGKAGVQVQPGTFLSPDFVAQNQVDQAAGKIDFAVSQMAPSEPASGSGVLVIITFKGKAGGTSDISFGVLLSDQDGKAINTNTQGGSVTVTGGPSPTPTNTPIPGITPTPSVTPTPPPGGILGYHTVRSGETLYCIGRAYGVDPYAIARQNGILNPNVIRAGHVLAIPNVPRALPPGRICPRQFNGGTPTPPTCRWHHTVVWGENLYRISIRYGVSMWAVAEANHITNLNLIFAGQVLCIP